MASPITYAAPAVEYVSAAPYMPAPAVEYISGGAPRNYLAMGNVVQERIISIEELAATGRYDAAPVMVEPVRYIEEFAQPTYIQEYVQPAPMVEYASAAPAVQYVTSPQVEYITSAAPMVEYTTAAPQLIGGYGGQTYLY